MGEGIIWANVIVGFGGVFLLGVIGAVVHWYLGRLDDRDARNQHQSSTKDTARRSNA